MAYFSDDIKIHYVYILKLYNGKYYTGITNDCTRRLLEHSKGRSKSTKYNLPFQLIFLVSLYSRQASRKLEVYIKNKGARKYMTQNKLDGNYYNIVEHVDMLNDYLKVKHKVVVIDGKYYASIL